MVLVGVVGKPNVGKSTFFKAATLSDTEIANYPFTTIKPNHGVGFVSIKSVSTEYDIIPNPRMGYWANHKRFIPVDMLDVAGLVPGAYEGHGMGNQFLDDLRQADVLIHVIDLSGSANAKGEPVEPLGYDPAEDIRFLDNELDHWYLGILERGWEKFARQIQQEHKEVHKALAKQLSGLKVTEEMVKEAIKRHNLIDVEPTLWTKENLFSVAQELRKETKPMIIAANKMDVPGAYDNLKRLQSEFPDYTIVPCSAESELALTEAAKAELITYVSGENTFTLKEGNTLSENQKKALDFIRTSILEPFGSTGVQDVMNKAVFEVLGYIAIYPGGVNKFEDSDGNVLPDCFLLPKGSSALDFAYKLHTDFGKNFIKAIDVRTKRVVGKEHALNHRDIIEIYAK